MGEEVNHGIKCYDPLGPVNRGPLLGREPVVRRCCGDGLWSELPSYRGGSSITSVPSGVYTVTGARPPSWCTTYTC